MKRHIPNILTLGNLLCGTIALVYALQGHFTATAVFFLAGIAFDFLDGFVARMLHVKSDIGKELDSLADLVTSGAVPSMVMFVLMRESVSCCDRVISDGTIPFTLSQIYALPAFLIVLFSALRLAKFNLDTRQSDSFIGLPTPASGLVFVFLPFLIEQMGTWGQIRLSNYGFLLLLTLSGCWLMVGELRLFALKFKNFGWRGNEKRWIILLLALILILIFRLAAFPLIVVCYVLLSLIKTKPAKTETETLL